MSEGYKIVVSLHPCKWCDLAKELLKEKGFEFEEEVLATRPQLMAFQMAGYKTVPQVFLNDVLIGGYAELHASFR